MKKISMLLFFLAFAGVGKAQNSFDPVKVYANDSTGFIQYAEVNLLENLKLPVKYAKLEINTWISPYARGKVNYHEYRNLYRYPNPVQKLPDSTVLTKCDLLKCFTSCWCPDFLPWYISAQTSDHKLVTVGDTIALRKFLGKIDNNYKAYLWLLQHDEYSDIPLKTSDKAKYKKVKNGYLVSYRTRINGFHHVAYADMTYFIDDDFRIMLISKKHIVETNYMI